MRARVVIFWLMLLVFAPTAWSFSFRINGSMLPEEYMYLVSGSMNIADNGETGRITLADSSYVDLYYFPTGDSTLLIRTQCAPLCGSFVRIYDANWNILRTIPTPSDMILPEAYIRDGELRWRDNHVEDETPE